MSPRDSSPSARIPGQSSTAEYRKHTGSDRDLIRALHQLDGRSYPGYKSVLGMWDFGSFSLSIDRIQADPYAPPSKVRAISTPQEMGLPQAAISSSEARLACADYLLRAFNRSLRERRLSDLQVMSPSVEILERSACTVKPDRVELRFEVRMPARGRTILGRRAAQIFDLDIPDAIQDTFDYLSDIPEVERERQDLLHHIEVYEDYCALQSILSERGWVSFVANGSVLARRSGVSQFPLADAIPFSSPSTLEAEVELPHAGALRGMAIEPGVTVIVGGGYHGKSTLLGAIQRGVYAHIPGDGREYVATAPNAMKVRAADGRAVTGVDVSPFITHLPGNADTSRFSTENASGSTSQAASLVEAIELGSPLLLIDEDTSATNLMIRDGRMRELVQAEKEPITPLVDRISSLHRDLGVSTILVMGGSGDYLDHADRVLMMDHYRCVDVTDRAREVVSRQPRPHEDLPMSAPSEPRLPIRLRAPERAKTKAAGLSSITLDKVHLDLGDVEQIVDPGQTEAIAWMVRGLLFSYADGKLDINQLLARLERAINSEGLDVVAKSGAHSLPGHLARPRLVDVAAAVNRFRGLRLGESANN